MARRLFIYSYVQRQRSPSRHLWRVVVERLVGPDFFIFLAYAGEWKMVHIDYPNEFPNDPGTDHGFRLKMLYWMSTGAMLMLSHWLFCGLSTIIAIVAVVRKSALLRNRSWQIAISINLFALLYALTKYVAFKFR